MHIERVESWLLSTGDVAGLRRVSRQHVVDLRDLGDLIPVRVVTSACSAVRAGPASRSGA
jgi:hypothetical protein